VNLDDRTARRYSLGSYAINRFWRERTSQNCLYDPEMRYMFTMSSITQVAEFRQLGHLHRLLHTKFEAKFDFYNGPTDSPVAFGTVITGVISITFNLDELSAL